MRRLFVLIAVLVGSIALPGMANAAAKSCAGAVIATATIEQVQAAPARFLGKCIRLRGILADGRLYADRQATLEIHDRTADDRRPKRSIVILDVRERAPASVEITGRLNDCGCAYDALDSYQADHPDEIVMLSGFCHTSMETYLKKPAIRILSAKPIARLVEAEVPAEKRLLVEAPAGVPRRSDHAETARKTLAAIAARDEAAYLRMAFPEVSFDADQTATRPDWLRDDMKEAHAAFLKTAAVQPIAARIVAQPDADRRVFIEADDFRNFLKEGAEPYRAITCWCTANDCTGRWPIAPALADNLPGRPYFCISTQDYVLGPGKGSVLSAELPEARTGFAEPAR